MAIKLLIGLRNPGDAYQSTRHNAGEWLVSSLAANQGAIFQEHKKFHGEVASLTTSGVSYYALLPNTFMNRSGLSARSVSQFYRILPQEILVVHDELDLPAGQIKLKTGGGHGGHNGLKDLIAQLGSADFHRLRIGIGHPGHKNLVVDYVLGKPSREDKEAIIQAISQSLEVMPLILAGSMAEAMNRLNR